MGINLFCAMLIWWSVALFSRHYAGRVDGLKPEEFTYAVLISRNYKEVLIPSFKALLKLQMLAAVFAAMNGVC